MSHRPLIHMLVAALVAFGGLTIPGLGQTLLLEARGGLGMRDVVKPDTNFLDPTRLRDINAELLVSIPNPATLLLPGEFRPHLGASFDPGAGDGFAYAGLSWTVRAPVVPVFVEAGLGAAVQSDVINQGASRFGCAVQAQAQASVGLDVLPNLAVMVSVQHIRDFGLCGQADNPMSNAGLRLGVRF